MGKWGHDELNRDFDVVDDPAEVYVHRNFSVYDEKMSELSRLENTLNTMFDGLVHTEYIEGVFDVYRRGPRSKPRFTIELTVGGCRKVTEDEADMLQQEEEDASSDSDRHDLRRLKAIKERAPHLFDKL